MADNLADNDFARFLQPSRRPAPDLLTDAQFEQIRAMRDYIEEKFGA